MRPFDFLFFREGLLKFFQGVALNFFFLIIPTRKSAWNIFFLGGNIFNFFFPQRTCFFLKGLWDFFSWGMAFDIFFLLENGPGNFFLSIFSGPRPKIINGRPLMVVKSPLMSIIKCHCYRTTNRNATAFWLKFNNGCHTSFWNRIWKSEYKKLLLSEHIMFHIENASTGWIK